MTKGLAIALMFWGAGTGCMMVSYHTKFLLFSARHLFCTKRTFGLVHPAVRTAKTNVGDIK
jgi:hypothetical protein